MAAQDAQRKALEVTSPLLDFLLVMVILTMRFLRVQQLMGMSSASSSRRSGGSSSSNFLLKFTDPRVCRPFLVGHCPHDLFSSTKFELGPCRNQHNERLKADYLEAPNREQYGYEWDYARVLRDYVSECDKRIGESQTKLETTYEEIFRQKQLVCPSSSKFVTLL